MEQFSKSDWSNLVNRKKQFTKSGSQFGNAFCGASGASIFSEAHASQTDA